ncbi:NAD(P)-dependent oxidoreductase [Mucilaginibacter paludis]|uniref:NADH-flavin reductase-like protein n=1 Tax=Mucilaginibacter paludis DSM 18603 TaxID=714943 RepID=H1YIQ5_9SPHI|nr:NAD(P)H-binding protein [Mucilaginibacter paludis]EHQ27600.1 putative NADH-flavin reductase-like protein [Mucilaginibacter paludis DSM 18603]
MTQNITVALLGGTGKTGSYLTYQLLSHGFKVRSLIRRPEVYPVSPTLMEVVKGDIKDPQTAHLLLQGCDVVISTIGQIKGETLISSLATTNILCAMREFNIKRYILITGLTLDMPGDNKTEYIRQLTDYMKQTYPEIVADKQSVAAILDKSDIDWTIVRLPYIETTDERWHPVVDLHDCPGGKISTTDLAYFLISQISDRQYIRKAPFIGSDR